MYDAAQPEGRLQRAAADRSMSRVPTPFIRCPYHKRRCKCPERRKSAMVAAHEVHLQTFDTPEIRLAKRFSEALRLFPTENLSSTLVPSRIGHNNKDIDHAIRAVIQARLIENRGRATGSAYYQRSLHALQRACKTTHVSEETLMIATQCSLYEIITMPSQIPVFRHADGIAAMFKSRQPHEWQPFEYARTLFYESWFMVLYNPMLRGAASPFDDGQQWTALLPSQGQIPRPETGALRFLAQNLFIKLPRLIAQVRACSPAYHGPTPAIDTAADLARPLFATRDDAAEDYLLSNVTTSHPTKDLLFAWFVSNSYGFPLYADAAAAVYYWITRLILLRLCAVIVAQASPRLLPRFPTMADIVQERKRLLGHLLRSLDHHRDLSPFGRSPYFFAMAPIYGAIDESEDFTTEEKLRLCQAIVASWLSMSHGMIPAYPESVLLMIGGVMKGGPLPPPP